METATAFCVPFAIWEGKFTSSEVARGKSIILNGSDGSPSRFRRKLKWFSVKSSSRPSLGRGDASSSTTTFVVRGSKGWREIVEIVRKIDFDWSDNLWLNVSDSLYFFSFFAEECFEKIFLKVGCARRLLWNFARQHTLSTKGSREKGQIQIPKTDWCLIKLFSPSCINPSSCRCLSLLCISSISTKCFQNRTRFFFKQTLAVLDCVRTRFFFSVDEWMLQPSVMDLKKMQAV